MIALLLSLLLVPLKTPDPDGAVLFRRNCIECHGYGGQGVEGKGTPDFTSKDWQQSITDAQILNTITNGKDVQGGDEKMPSFKDELTAPEIKALLKRLREFGKQSAPK